MGPARRAARDDDLRDRLDRDLGSIEAGKLADLVVLEGNLLDDIRNTNTIRQVMMNGRPYDGDTLDEVFPRQRPLAPLWRWDAESRGGRVWKRCRLS